jgi:hypothetical protein
MSDTDKDALIACITSMYEAYGDRARFDAHLDPSVTIWESDCDEMLVGLAALDALRDERAGDKPVSPDERVRPVPEVVAVDVYDGVGVVRYALRVVSADGTPLGTEFRVSDVLRRADDGWRIVHHHAEQVAS